MATAELNPEFLSISGRFGNAVFYMRLNTQCVRTYVVPRNPDTSLQRAVRKSFAGAVRSWQQMSSEERYAYTRKARGLGMSGYNLYISEYMTGRKTVQTKYKTAAGICTFQKDTASLNRIHSVSIPYNLPEAVNMRLVTDDKANSLINYDKKVLLTNIILSLHVNKPIIHTSVHLTSYHN